MISRSKFQTKKAAFERGDIYGPQFAREIISIVRLFDQNARRPNKFMSLQNCFSMLERIGGIDCGKIFSWPENWPFTGKKYFSYLNNDPQ